MVFTGTFMDPGKEAAAASALLDQGVDVPGVIVDSPITVVQTAEQRGAYSVGYHYLGVRKFAPKGWISGIAFTWGDLYARFAQEVGEAVPGDAVKLVNAKRGELLAGKAQVFQGPLKDNRGVERVKAGRAGLAPRSPCSRHLAGRKVGGNDDKVSKGACTKQRPVVTANATRLVSQETMDPTKPRRRSARSATSASPRRGCRHRSRRDRSRSVGP